LAAAHAQHRQGHLPAALSASQAERTRFRAVRGRNDSRSGAGTGSRSGGQRDHRRNGRDRKHAARDPAGAASDPAVAPLGSRAGPDNAADRSPITIPWFALLLVGAGLLNSLAPLPPAWLHTIAQADNFVLCMAMAALESKLRSVRSDRPASAPCCWP